MAHRSWIALGLWSAGLAAALWFLHSIGRGDLAPPPVGDVGAMREWPSTVGLDAAVLSMVRLAALAMSWYLVASTVLGSLVRVSGSKRAQIVTDRATPGFLRSMLGSATTMSAAGLTLAVSPLLGSGAAGPLVPDAAVAEAVNALGSVDNGEPGADADALLEAAPADAATATLERIDIAVLAALDASELAGPSEEIAVGIGAGSAMFVTWTVETGDHLWHIAEETLEEHWGRTVSDAEIAPYWQQLVETNRSTFVVADNPDLIYPGQVMRLPPVPDDS